MSEGLQGQYSVQHSEKQRPTVSIMKACEHCNVSRRTIYNWLSAGKLEYIRTAGGSVRIFEDSLWRPANRTEVHRGSLNSPYAPKVP